MIHTATHDCGMWEPRCAPVTPGSVKVAVELRADELLAVSKRRDVERERVVSVVEEEEECRGERGGLEMSSRDWNLGGGSPRLKATCSKLIARRGKPSPQSPAPCNSCQK